MRQVYINGHSTFTALGDESTAAANIKNRRSPIGSYNLAVDDVSHLPAYLFPFSDCSPSQLVERVVLKALSASTIEGAEILKNPLLIGSSALAIWLEESRVINTINAQMNTEYGSNLGVPDLAKNLGAEGGFVTINTACTSSANALLYGCAMIACGEVEHLLVIGFDGMNRATVAGFNAMALLSDKVRPFDTDRSGIILGEAVSAIVLSSTPHSKYRVRLLGGANHGDTVSPTGTDEKGRSISRVINQAIANAGISPGQIQLIKAQAAGSVSNDLAEANGLHRSFSSLPSISSLKGYIGHTLGASGCCELSLLLSCFSNSFVPATTGFLQSDNVLDISPLVDHQYAVPEYTLLNYFGFGGNNTALVLQCEQVN